ncbi:actinorhodin polyketide synthase acyl carrier protein [Amycolatopsis deserti]|uniref:Actinorhodin polyketide synthase acyl carrier protein n=1 Tax=Amycolatopsis deserti TaxID=185696 RepID=A0ABQ3JHU3_9PSEU|nr:acyl carrier protein [Amycolatopsis deserti]GHF18958.1 actinorhodin polyketide synthase acyl carrier protein [Amycolatopsis deserti]
MSTLTITALKDILRSAAGEDDGVDLDAEILDTPFAELGYDSLALLETAARIAREYGVTLSDDDVDQIETPRELLDRVNAAARA